MPVELEPTAAVRLRQHPPQPRISPDFLRIICKKSALAGKHSILPIKTNPLPVRHGQGILPQALISLFRTKYKIKNPAEIDGVFYLEDYSSAGAPTGQTPAQAPQEMQVSASITNLPSPSLIAETGHSSAHAPHATHSSLITYAMIKYLHN